MNARAYLPPDIRLSLNLSVMMTRIIPRPIGFFGMRNVCVSIFSSHSSIFAELFDFMSIMGKRVYDAAYDIAVLFAVSRLHCNEVSARNHESAGPADYLRGVTARRIYTYGRNVTSGSFVDARLKKATELSKVASIYVKRNDDECYPGVTVVTVVRDKCIFRGRAMQSDEPITLSDRAHCR